LVMAEGLHLAVGIILLLCVLRTTSASGYDDEGELNSYADGVFEVSLVY